MADTVVYATKELLRSRIASLEDDDLQVTDSVLDEIIKEITAKINGVIPSCYVTPIVEEDSPASFLILQSIAVDMARAEIAKIKATTLGTGIFANTRDEPRPVINSSSEFNRLRDGTLKLPDAKTVSSGSCPQLHIGVRDIRDEDSTWR